MSRGALGIYGQSTIDKRGSTVFTPANINMGNFGTTENTLIVAGQGNFRNSDYIVAPAVQNRA